MSEIETPLRVLIVEDSADDAALVLRALRKGGYAPESCRVDTADAMRAALKDKPWDIILSDYVIPGFGGVKALRIATDSGLDLPFILISGKKGEETAVAAMKAGASDFVMKDRLARLPSVVKRELADAAARHGVRRAEIEWRTAFDSVRDAIFFHDSDGRIVRTNRAYAALARMPVEEAIGRKYWEVFPKLPGPLPGCRAIIEGRCDSHEDEFTLPSGESYLSRAFVVPDERGEYIYSLHVLRDITERNRVRDALEKSERRYRKLIERGSDAFFVVDRTGALVYCSDSGKRLTGWEVSDALGRNITTLVHPDDVAAGRDFFSQILAQPDRTARFELRVMHKDGFPIDAGIQARNLLDDPDVGGIVMTVHDITERKKSEHELKLFRTLVDQSNDAIEVLDPATLRYLDVNDRACLNLGYTREELLSMTVYDINPELDPTAGARMAARLSVSNFAVLESMSRRKDGSMFPVEVSIRSVDLDRNYQVAVVRDITERKRAELRQRGILDGAIEALSAMVEQRDAYTAGHQRRVAQLAVAIGRELALDEDRLAGLRIAGTIHDIGKISVPAEILVRPGRISPIEFEMIKSHAQMGYEIVKGIEFPWPVADAIRQHHERLDGSGYPQGLKGDEIILEARILTVADVVEAMSSHRPYRPALAMDAALQEIEDERGRWFDPAVVDACLRLFRDKDFAFAKA